MADQSPRKRPAETEDVKMDEADPAAEPPLKRVRHLGLPACHEVCRGHAAATTPARAMLVLPSIVHPNAQRFPAKRLGCFSTNCHRTCLSAGIVTTDYRLAAATARAMPAPCCLQPSPV